MENKEHLRARILAQRAAVSKEVAAKRDRAIITRILHSEAYKESHQILLYAPIKGEIDLIPLVRAARKDGKEIAFPRCDIASNTMQFHILTPDARLRPGAYGIYEPPADAPVCTPDEKTLCITPGTTFDRMGNRLGNGRGYYDRYLKKFPGVTAGVVYHALMSEALTPEAHDVPVDLLFTDRKTISCHEEGQVPENAMGAFLGRTVSAVREYFVRLSAGMGKNGNAAPQHIPAALVLTAFLLVLLSRLVMSFAGRKSELILCILLQLIIFLVPIYLYEHFYHKRTLKELPKHLRLTLFRPQQIWFLVCMLVVMISGSLLSGIVTGGIADTAGNFTLYATFVAKSDGSFLSTLLLILAYGILPAVCEEFLFRGILPREYERYGVAVAITVSSVFFAMLHFSFSLLLTYLLMGALLSLALYTTRSLLSSILLHLCYNLFCLFGQPFLSAFYNNAGSRKIFIFCIVVIFLLFAAFAVGEARKIYHLYAKRNQDSSYTAPIALKKVPECVLRVCFSYVVGVLILLWVVVSAIGG